MANPNLTTITAAVADVVAEAQLGTTATAFTAPSGKAWKLASGTVCNTSTSTVTLTMSVVRVSGGTARVIVSTYPITAGDTLDITPYLPVMLPEGGAVRAAASAAAALDLIISGTVLG